MNTLANALNTAIGRRDKLLKVTNALRLVNGTGDGLDGLLIDRYHKHFQIQVLKGHWHQQMDEICKSLASSLPVEYLIVKTRQGLEIRQEILAGTDPETIVSEYGIKFKVNLNDGLNCGLFLDMRHNRRMVGEFAKARKVLNCFSYTCAFGVHARAQGACEVINTDISRKVLERGKINYQLNDMTPSPGEFVKVDSVSYLQRALKKNNKFDVIILDPPSFARYDEGVFQVKRDMPELIDLSVRVLNGGGALWVSTNYSETSYTDLEKMLADHLNGRRVAQIQRVRQDEDFTLSNSFKESYLVGLWVKFL